MIKTFKLFPTISFLIIVLFFFKPFIFENKLPIPSDTIIGLYHPFRDLYAKDYPNGIPFKNFLITDPVRQQYPWRELAVSVIKKFELPFWNPYNFAGTPLLANMQSGVFYPFNILFFILPFSIGWSLLIIAQPFMAGIFLYFYLNNLKINKWASLIGAIAFSFSGFSIAWMEWNTVVHVGLWLPLVLLSIDKVVLCFVEKSKINPSADGQKSKLSPYGRSPEGRQFKIKNYLIWVVIFIFSLASSFFAGHLQIFFYLFIFSFIYLVIRCIQYGRIFNILFVFFIFYILFFISTSIQWVPTLQFINESARDIDRADWQKEGWFIPWQHLIQFAAPDFLGNPTTLNYWGTWNYGELVGYIGIFPLLMAIFALFFRHDKKTLFFGTVFFISLLFSLPTIFAKIPYVLNIPFLSTSQPTRLLFITDLSLAILAAFGIDYLVRSKTNKILYPLGFIAFIFLALWSFVAFGNEITKVVSEENILVAKRNLIFPTLVFFISSILLSFRALQQAQGKLRRGISLKLTYIIIVVLVAADLIRFGWKFTPFTTQEYLFPKTKTIEFLQNKLGYHRVMTTDSRILPPNFSAIYRLQSVDGYDPLYLRRYGELIAVSERGEPNISPPFGFNRIITPHNFESKIIDLLGVKYVLSLSDLGSPKLKKVFQEGETRVYENKNVLPRAFFTEDVIVVNNKKEAIEKMFDDNFDLIKTAVVEESRSVNRITHPICKRCEAKIVLYSENKILIETKTDNYGFLVLTDSYYPSWRIRIDGRETKIFRTDYNFRGVFVPEGEHRVEFYIQLF